MSITMRDNEKTNENLEKLCQPLNVDKTLQEIADEHEDLTLRVDDLSYQKEDIESDLGDYKEELEALKEKIQDFKVWLDSDDVRGRMTADHLLRDVQEEFKNLFDL